jgi:type II secretory pathway pseudopilin PulG
MKRKEGFALIAALALMAFLVLLIVSLAGLARVETQVGAANRQAAQARQNALFALEEALAQLQASLGDDRSVSARADILGANVPESLWTGAWAVRGGDLVPLGWLVSGEEPDPQVALEGARPARAGPGATAVRLRGNTATGEAHAPLVLLERSSATGETEVYGRYAFWLGDENVKARILPEGSPPPGMSDLPQTNAFATFHRRALSATPFLGAGTDSPEFRAQFADLRVARQAEFIGEAAVAALRDHPHDLSFLGDGMLVDTVRGGFRTRILADDLANTLPTPYFGARRYIEMDGVFHEAGDSPFAVNVAAYGPSIPQEETATPRFEGFHPIITEAIMRCGAFYSIAASDYVRIRFHIEVELANPYPFPLDLTLNGIQGPGTSGLVSYHILVTGLPTVIVQNGETFLGELDMNNLQQGASGQERPGAFSSVVELERINRNGRLILEPGQTIRMTNPNQDRQPQGLSRFDPSFRINAEEARAGGENVQIRIVFPDDYEGTNFILVPIQNDWREDPRDLPAAFGVTAVPFADDRFLMEEVGRPFFVATSGDFVVEDYSFGFHFKLLDDPTAPSGLAAFFNEFDLRRPIINFQEHPEHFEILSNRPGEIAIIDDFFSDLDGFDQDNTLEPRLYDIPLTPAASLATLRVAPATGFPPYALGRPGHPTLNEIFDTHIWLPDEAPWLRDDGSDPATTEGVRVEGLFNINSTSARAWQSVLTHGLSDYTTEDGALVTAEAFFARQPFGSITLDAIEDDFAISDTATTAFSQGMRLVEANALAGLAENIVEGVRREGPFGSLEAFLESNVLSDALAEFTLNSDLEPPPGSLLEIDAGDLAMKLTPIMSARSDTFVIRTYGDVINPVTGRVEGRAACEAVVRRFPEFVDGSAQRRFRVVQFRWLDLDTL